MIKLLISTLWLWCLIGPVFAAPKMISMERPQVAVLSLIAANAELTSNEAARLVQRQTGGKVLRVKDMGGSYQVKVLLPSGVVKSYSVNKVKGTIS